MILPLVAQAFQACLPGRGADLKVRYTRTQGPGQTESLRYIRTRANPGLGAAANRCT